ncbi:PadR family transcriptional regulator [Pelagibacterium xiamenense]|uniref:PadR family transcriptional regulator n=1 Tax=Pelagibacterium xiamenense TaxID=2901140 RepID=UPI001E475B32|nr:PadR family transcriptional regulator [Pelagibacterium xiamenense]MCD7059548.1 PadR family transcriptional regulator [Pelagibacterium xiamenense]
MAFDEYGRDPHHRRPRRGLHHEGRGDGDPRSGMGRRRGKIFDAKELQLVLLSLIAEAPRHGYELIRDIEERTNGAYAPSPGMVYPTLTLLADMGHAEEAETSGARKTFAATEAGKAVLAEEAEQLGALMDRLSMLAERTERVDAAPVRRAIGNLRSAIRGRLSREGVTEDTIFAVAQLIDEAAGKIERLK